MSDSVESATPAPKQSADMVASLRGTERVVVALLASTLFVNAALLFVVQPLFSKLLLPRFGGAPAVWTTCMLFFQTGLLLGYLYAHASSRFLASDRQALLHVALLGLAALTLPLAAARALPAVNATPVAAVVILLTLSIGAPFVVLSGSAPIIQRWLGDSNHPGSRNPYVLYAASNAGSLVGLLAYPLLLEPQLSLLRQRQLWAFAFVALCVLVATSAFVLRRTGYLQSSAATVVEGHSDEATVVNVRAAVTTRQRVMWLLLSFVPSSLLLGATQYLSTDVAQVPLLWLIPLSLYLVTFIIAFARDGGTWHRVVVHAQPLVMLALLASMSIEWPRPWAVDALVQLVGFFIMAMMCHGELARRRPSVTHLTEFFLWIALGGVLGGVFNVLVAPMVFDSIAEYPLALVAASALRPWSRARTSRVAWALDLLLPAGLLLGLVVAPRVFPSLALPSRRQMAFLALCLAGMVVLIRRPIRFALGAGAFLIGVWLLQGGRDGTLFADRSFFGVHRVTAAPTYHLLEHGTTFHGIQLLDPARRREPTMYYHREGPVAQIFAALPNAPGGRRVAVGGLGTGTIACYGRPSDVFTFYEIDPLVGRIARDPTLFTYLRDCDPTVRVEVGDARLRLAEAADGSYDLIVLDVFSSDAVPLHLLTREALALYLRKLGANGMLVFHVSNRYLDLEPALAELAADAGLATRASHDIPTRAAQRDVLATSSTWVTMARHAEDLVALTGASPWEPLARRDGFRVWTDDFSNIWQVFQWKR